VEPLELGARLQPELRVEIGQRFVHQVDGRVPDDRARQRDTLLLSARQLRGTPGEHVGEAHAAAASRTSRSMSAAAAPPRARRKRDVVENGEVRLECVVLKDHRDVALGGLERVHAAVADPDGAGVEPLEPGEEPQAASSCRSPTARAAPDTRRRRRPESTWSTALCAPKRFVTHSNRTRIGSRSILRVMTASDERWDVVGVARTRWTS